MRTLARFAAAAALVVAVAGMTAWSGLAIYYSDIRAAGLRTALAMPFVVASSCTRA